MSYSVTVILLSGPISVGKTLLAENLMTGYRADHLRTSALIAASTRHNADRTDLQDVGMSPPFRGGDWLVQAVRERVEKRGASLVVVDAVRTREQVQALRQGLPACRIAHIHLLAKAVLLAERFTSRERAGDAELSWHQAMEAPAEAGTESLKSEADLVLDTTLLTPEDVTVRVVSYIRPHGRHKPNVDVLVGGQWGSEGKGNVAFYLAPEYDLLVRVGAPNAGHKVRNRKGEVYTHRQLPSGTQATTSLVLLGPGAVIDVNILLREIKDCGLSPERLTIDRRALIIETEDVKREVDLKKAIGSTGTGGGAAVARRIMERTQATTVRMAQDIPELASYIGDSAELFDRLQENESVFVEGTQGTGLSVLHGSFPHVTSRDTTVGTLLGEIGIAPQLVRHVISVFRTYPIRVGGQSGPMGREITWETVAERSGIQLEDLLRSERGSVSHNQRRVAEFSWSQLVTSTRLNGATDIALTFADYLDVRNRRACRFDQLAEETARFVDDIEMVARVPVSFVSVGFDGRGPIDRRQW